MHLRSLLFGPLNLGLSRQLTHCTRSIVIHAWQLPQAALFCLVTVVGREVGVGPIGFAPVRFDLVGFCPVGAGRVRLGAVRFGVIGFGPGRFGIVGFCPVRLVGVVRFCLWVFVLSGLVLVGLVLLGFVLSGLLLLGFVRFVQYLSHTRKLIFIETAVDKKKKIAPRETKKEWVKRLYVINFCNCGSS